MRLDDDLPTQPVTTIEYEDRTSAASEIVRITNRRPPTERPLATPVGVRKVPTVPVAKLAPVAIPPVTARPGTAPPTIIPIPRLPSLKDRHSQIQPVVTSPASRPSRTRLAKGTGPVSSGTTQLGVAPPPPIRAGEDDDKTSPSISLPAAARSVTLPSIKRLSR